jgi:hypothetical protein
VRVVASAIARRLPMAGFTLIRPAFAREVPDYFEVLQASEATSMAQ